MGISHESPMVVEDNERGELLGLGSPTSSPPSTPAHSNNKSSLEFLRSIRSLIGDLVYMHFGNSWVQKSNLSLCCVPPPPVFLHRTFTPGPSSLRPFWSCRQAQAWEWSPSSPSALHDREQASLPFI